MININTPEKYLTFKNELIANKFTDDELRRFTKEAIDVIRNKATEIAENPGTTAGKKFKLSGNGGLVDDLTYDKIDTSDPSHIKAIFQQELALTILSFNTFVGGYTGTTALKAVPKTAALITITSNAGLMVPFSNIASATQKYEEESLDKGINPYEPLAPAKNSLTLLPPNNLVWANVRPRKAVLSRRRPIIRGQYNNKNGNNISVSLPPLQVTNTPRRRVNRNIRNTRLRQGNVQAGSPNFSSAAAAIPASPAKPNRGTIRNAIGNVARGGPIGINRGANPAAKNLRNRRLLPRGPAGNVPFPELPGQPALPLYIGTGGTRKKKNK